MNDEEPQTRYQALAQNTVNETCNCTCHSAASSCAYCEHCKGDNKVHRHQITRFFQGMINLYSNRNDLNYSDNLAQFKAEARAYWDSPEAQADMAVARAKLKDPSYLKDNVEDVINRYVGYDRNGRSS